jgi:hypothetical protein
MIRPDDIRELLKKQPFQPFRIHLSNGKSYTVSHPELAYVMRATIVVARLVPGDTDPEPIGDGFNVISILHIYDLEIMSPAPAGHPKNGAA